jgi:hypothetical protein
MNADTLTFGLGDEEFRVDARRPTTNFSSLDIFGLVAVDRSGLEHAPDQLRLSS